MYVGVVRHANASTATTRTEKFCMYVCMYIMYVCMYVCIYMYVCMCVAKAPRATTCTEKLCMYIHLYIHACIHTSWSHLSASPATHA